MERQSKMIRETRIRFLRYSLKSIFGVKNFRDAEYPYYIPANIFKKASKHIEIILSRNELNPFYEDINNSYLDMISVFPDENGHIIYKIVYRNRRDVKELNLSEETVENLETLIF